jgi:hypothetical protein
VSKPSGTGSFFLLRDYGSEGWSIERFETEEALLVVVLNNEYGCPLLLAKELKLEISDE